MKTKNTILAGVLILASLCGCRSPWYTEPPTPTFTPNLTETAIATLWTATNTPTATATPVPGLNLLYDDFISVPGGTNPQYDTGSAYFNHTISPFYMAQYEVTYELWYTVRQWAVIHGYTFANLGNEGDDGSAGAPLTFAKYEPVTRINWRDCIVWCNAYSDMTGLHPVYFTDAGLTVPLKDSSDGAYGGDITVTAGSLDNPYVNWASNGYRLPTNGEWDLAAKYINGASWLPPDYASGATAAVTNAAATGVVAWYSVNSGYHTQNVGGKNPNALNIYDMSGNVWELCWDWGGLQPVVPMTDCRGPGPDYTYHQRIGRGGGIYVDNTWMEAGYRSGIVLYNEFGDVGFRLARTN